MAGMLNGISSGVSAPSAPRSTSGGSSWTPSPTELAAARQGRQGAAGVGTILRGSLDSMRRSGASPGQYEIEDTDGRGTYSTRRLGG